MDQEEDYVMEEEAEFEGPLVQTSPAILVSIFSFVTGIISSYGWFILVGVIVCTYVWKTLHPKVERWKEDAERHRNPDKFIERELSVSAARQKMQEQYDEMARKRAEQLKEEESRRREQGENVSGASSTPSLNSNSVKKQESNTTKQRLRPAFNPLMGDTSSCAFRPGGGRRRTGGG